MSTTIPTLDIVLPCYNPIDNWATTILTAYQSIQQQLPTVPIHLILVNDGSKHPIPQAAIDQLKKAIPSFQYLTYTPNQGKGYALRTGVAQTKSDLCIFTDVDFPYAEKSLVQVYQLLAQGEQDIVVGIKDADYYKNVPKMRRRISKFLRYLIRTFLRTSISDTQCGLKGFNQKGKALFLQTTINRYLFDLEFIFLADRTKDLNMQPIAVRLKEHVVFSTANWKILATEGWNFLQLFVKSLGSK